MTPSVCTLWLEGATHAHLIVRNSGAEEAHKLFEHQLLGSHPKPLVLDPQKKEFMCLISWGPKGGLKLIVAPSTS